MLARWIRASLHRLSPKQTGAGKLDQYLPTSKHEALSCYDAWHHWHPLETERTHCSRVALCKLPVLQTSQLSGLHNTGSCSSLSHNTKEWTILSILREIWAVGQLRKVGVCHVQLQNGVGYLD
jgi:hypothetical protein